MGYQSGLQKQMNCRKRKDYNDGGIHDEKKVIGNDDDNPQVQKIPRKAPSPLRVSAQSLHVATFNQNNINTSSSSFRSGRQNADYDSYHLSKNWREIPPQKGDRYHRTVDGKKFNWCPFCYNGRGLWTFHLPEEHKDDYEKNRRPWKYTAPKDGESHRKMHNNEIYLWCQKCNNGNGVWGKHSTSSHRDTQRDRFNRENSNVSHELVRKSSNDVGCNKVNGNESIRNSNERRILPGTKQSIATKKSNADISNYNAHGINTHQIEGKTSFIKKVMGKSARALQSTNKAKTTHVVKKHHAKLHLRRDVFPSAIPLKHTSKADGVKRKLPIQPIQPSQTVPTVTANFMAERDNIEKVTNNGINNTNKLNPKTNQNSSPSKDHIITKRINNGSVLDRGSGLTNYAQAIMNNNDITNKIDKNKTDIIGDNANGVSDKTSTHKNEKVISSISSNSQQETMNVELSNKACQKEVVDLCSDEESLESKNSNDEIELEMNHEQSIDDTTKDDTTKDDSLPNDSDDAEDSISHSKSDSSETSYSESVETYDSTCNDIDDSDDLASDKELKQRTAFSDKSNTVSLHNRQWSLNMTDNNRSRSKKDDINDEERNWLESKLELSAKDFLKRKDMFSISKILTTPLNDLCKSYLNCHKEMEWPMNVSLLATVTRWKIKAREYHANNYDMHIQAKAPIDSNKKSSHLLMQNVKHLTKTDISGGLLPLMKITAMNIHNENLYDFRVNIRQSKIPGDSGFGAFLTFLGARKLKAEAKRLSEQIRQHQMLVENDGLGFVSLDGVYNTSVSLVGNDLYGNGNTSHYPKTRFPLEAKMSDDKTIAVKLTPHNIHESVQELMNKYEVKIQENGLGLLEIFTEEDYENDNTIKFDSKITGCIDLGRYGPFSQKDRKTDTEFQLKDFIFDFEPAAWNFGVEEKLKGCTQVIDITDDCTGEPHILAKSQIPKYVNEVGHDEKLQQKQNVLPRDLDDRVVHYYIYQQEPMSKGETVELLVDYGSGYEQTRLRKGYGRANLYDRVQSDKNISAKQKRDHADRVALRDLIQSLTFLEIKDTLKFLNERIIDPIVKFTDAYFANTIARSKGQILTQTKAPTQRQLIARFRISWIGQLYRKRIDELINDRSNNVRLDSTTRKIYHEILSKTRLNPKPFFAMSLHHEDILKISKIQLSELFGDFVVRISHGYGLYHAYEPQLWCGLARKVFEELVTKLLKLIHTTRKQSKPIEEVIYDVASAAVMSLERSYKALSNTSDKQEHSEAFRSLGFVQTENETIRSHLLTPLSHQSRHCHIELDDSGVGTDTTMEQTALTDSIEIMCISMAADSNEAEQFSPLVVRICSIDGPNSNSGGHGMTSKKGCTKVDKEWYLCWQIVRVIHNVSEEFKKLSPEIKNYSLEGLCGRLGVNINNANKILAIKLKDPFPDMYHDHHNETLLIDENDSQDSQKSRKRSNDDTFLESEKSKFSHKNSSTTNRLPRTKPRFGSDNVKKIGSSTSANKPIANKPRQSEEETKRDKELKERMHQAFGSSTLPKYSDEDGTLPDGWRLEKVERTNSNRIDKYWYSKTGKSFRSRVSVWMFLYFMKELNNDEDLVLQKFPWIRR